MTLDWQLVPEEEEDVWLRDLHRRFPVSVAMWSSLSSLCTAFHRMTGDGNGTGRWRSYSPERFAELVLRRVLTEASGLRGVPTTWVVERVGLRAIARNGTFVASAAIPQDVAKEWGWR